MNIGGVVAQASPSPPEASQTDDNHSAVEERIPGCAETAVFTLLQSLGRETTFSEVTATFRAIDRPFDPRMVSIGTMRSALEQLGLPSEARQYSPSRSRSLPSPCIIYVPPSKSAQQDSLPVGHFVTLIGWKGDDAILLEWAPEYTSPTVVAPVAELEAVWGGIAIVPSRFLVFEDRLIAACLLLSGLCLALLWRPQLPRHRRAATILLLSLTLGCGQAAAPDPPQPTIIFSKPVQRFGTIPGDRSINSTFRFRTWGQTSVKIVSIEKDCGCTTIDGNCIGAELPPNTEHEFSVRIRPDGSGGESVMRRIEVLTEPPSAVPLVVMATYKLQERPIISVNKVAISVGHDEVPRTTIRVTNHRALDTKPLHLNPSRSSATHFQLKAQPLATDVNYRNSTAVDTLVIDLEGLGALPPGRHDGTVTLAVDDKAATTIPSTIEVRHPYVPRVNRLFLGQMQPGQPWQRSIGVDKSADWFSTPQLAVSGYQFTTRLTPDPALELEGEAPLEPGRFESTVELGFNSQVVPPVTIQIWGIVER